MEYLCYMYGGHCVCTYNTNNHNVALVGIHVRKHRTDSLYPRACWGGFSMNMVHEECNFPLQHLTNSGRLRQRKGWLSKCLLVQSPPYLQEWVRLVTGKGSFQCFDSRNGSLLATCANVCFDSWQQTMHHTPTYCTTHNLWVRLQILQYFLLKCA